MSPMIMQAKQYAKTLQASIPKYDVVDRNRAIEAELAYIRETVGFIDSVLHSLNCQQTEQGWLDGFWVDLYRLSPRGATPVYLIFVNNIRFESITQAVEYMANCLR